MRRKGEHGDLSRQGQFLAPPLQESLNWIDTFRRAELTGKDPQTVDTYTRVLWQVGLWLAGRPGSDGLFHPESLTAGEVGTYVNELVRLGYSWSHVNRVLTVLKRFGNWLIAQGVLSSHPTENVSNPAQPVLTPGALSAQQRGVLRQLGGQSASPRGAAIFALGYWAGCGVRDISRLLVSDTHLESGSPWLRIGSAPGRYREIPVRNEVRDPLLRYLASASRAQTSAYVFTSMRQARPVPEGDLDGWRLGEAAIHDWWKRLKATESSDGLPLIIDVTLHDLCRDFEHRAKQAGWQREELALYLGHALKPGRSGGQRIASTSAAGPALKEPQVRERLSRIQG